MLLPTVALSKIWKILETSSFLTLMTLDLALFLAYPDSVCLLNIIFSLLSLESAEPLRLFLILLVNNLPKLDFLISSVCEGSLLLSTLSRYSSA